MFQNKSCNSTDLLALTGGDMSQRNLSIQQERPGVGRAVCFDNIFTPPLLDDNHPPQCRIISCPKLIEIHAAGDPFTDCVAAVPIGRLCPRGVETRRLMPQLKPPYDCPFGIVNRKRHIGGVGEVVRYPCFGIEGIWIVGQ